MSDTGLRDVTVVHDGGNTALEHVTLTAESGELLAVVGPSGSGKSSLLRTMAGLMQVVSGDVLIEGRTVTRVPVHQRHVAMVFESTHLMPFLDVSRNLAFGLRTRGVPEQEGQERIAERSRSLRFSRLLPRKPGTLSAGEQGVVGIGRALVQQPSLFLLDEPLAHLDAGQRFQVRRQIVDVVKNLGVTTLYVTHDEAEAMAIGDRIAVLDAGRLVQLGTPGQLYAEPTNCFVAGFFGSPPIGWLPATPVSSAGTGGFRVGARTLPLWEPLPAALTGLDTEVVLGLRPEDVHEVAGREPDPSQVSLLGTIVRTEHLGREVVVTIEVNADGARAPGVDAPLTGIGRAQLHSRFSPTTSVRPGDAVEVAVDVTRAHVFDPATGRALHHPAP